MRRIRVVTDSTCDIPAQLAEEWGISVVPCYVNFGTQSYLDQVELSRSQFYHRLASDPIHPTTAAPPSGVFAEVYRRLLPDAAGIVSIHPPDHMSALRQSALNGWDMAKGEIPFLALDAGQLSMGLGWIVIRAAQAAANGADMSRIEALVAALRDRAYVFAALETVEYLQRSGRVGWARGTVGKLLRVRPLLKVYQGEISSLGFVRTRRRATAALVAQIEMLGELEYLTVLHSNAPERADGFRQQLAQHDLPQPILTVNITPALGSHTGPDGLGLAAIQR